MNGFLPGGTLVRLIYHNLVDPVISKHAWALFYGLRPAQANGKPLGSSTLTSQWHGAQYPPNARGVPRSGSHTGFTQVDHMCLVIVFDDSTLNRVWQYFRRSRRFEREAAQSGLFGWESPTAAISRTSAFATFGEVPQQIREATPLLNSFRPSITWPSCLSCW